MNSLEWSLDQGDKAIWVNNSSRVDVAGSEIVEIARGQIDQDPLCRKIGERLLLVLKDMRDEF